jgi:hypothetical protein
MTMRWKLFCDPSLYSWLVSSRAWEFGFVQSVYEVTH